MLKGRREKERNRLDAGFERNNVTFLKKFIMIMLLLL